jgi:hypothetical protein
MSDFLHGSICLSDIPRELIKKVSCKDGKDRLFLNISVSKKKVPDHFGYTHFVSCAPKKEERKEGVQYIIGDLKEYVPPVSDAVQTTPKDIEAAPPANDDDLPF